MTRSNDAAVREAAIDPTRSFLVQAPAGSGKTELLIQRYLRLLGCVDEPEQVLAITFTRKAAAEMRTRVLLALDDARAQSGPLAAHRLTTRRLAEAAMQRDAERSWGIAADPNRLRIQTLDSFNTDLAMRLPLLAGGIGSTDIVDDASTLYAEAARCAVETIWRGSRPDADLALVFAELDYSVRFIEELVADLLASREQWIYWLFDADALSTGAETFFERLERRKVDQIETLMRDGERGQLFGFVRHAHANGNEGIRAATAGIMTDDPCRQWRAAANLVLVKDGLWRRQLSVREGFGPAHKLEKEAFAELIAGLSENAALQHALIGLRKLPENSRATDDQRLLAAVASLLRRALAELSVLFAEQRVADFTELGLTAQRALGQVDAPSELLLALDRRLQHILVDEFQDTSATQFRLLSMLTEGWQRGDGRTLFLVGDPMQSIYRFRNADMSLFIGARRFGVGSVRLEMLHLSANFRSAPIIVDWVNETFGRCFPRDDDLVAGLAAFHPSNPTRAAESDDRVQCHALDSAELADEHAEVLKTIAAERSRHADSSIAILVRSRGHLAGFQALLRAHGWQARAVEIDAPHTAQLTQDLIGLARALTHVGDRLAWLALLRAPWCGLTWSELEILVGDDERCSVWEWMHDAERLEGLDTVSRARLLGLRSEIARAFERRAHLPFVAWLYETWRRIDGPAALVDGPGNTELETVLAIFQRAIEDEDVADVADLERFFTRPVREADSHAGSIDIMTIHRAKGLEFDCVILPGLARRPRPGKRRLIEWLETYDDHGQRERIVAPLQKSESEAAAWIRARAREHDLAETARLMYVATTRARQRLHLVWGLQESGPPAASLLAPVWASVGRTHAAEKPEPVSESASHLRIPLRRLSRGLPISARQPPEADTQRPAADAGSYGWTSSTAAHVGTVVHEWLQSMCETTAPAWDEARIDAGATSVRAHLELLGVPRRELQQATALVQQALRGVLRDPRGRWIIGERDEAQSELMLSSAAGNQIVHHRLDRTFVEDGVRWIIDYKTASCDASDIDAFLASELVRHRPQLEGYAAAMGQLDPRPIRLGLYFPMLPAFCDWPAPGG